MNPMSTPNSVIVTFYSYKGGVGRSMAMANVAYLLAQRYGKRVIAVDWDLEAPGLHRFFDLPQESIRTGLIDLLYDYKDMLRQETDSLPKELVKLDEYLTPVSVAGANKGSISLLAAGRMSDEYAGRVNEFRWKEFYDKWHGYGFMEYLKGELKKKADIVLLDSRTGVTDIGGICTLQMPDVVVLLFAPNEQNLAGIETVIASINKQAPELEERRKPPVIVIRAARVEKYLELDRKNLWENEAAARLKEHMLPNERETDEAALRALKKTSIPYVGAFSFGETPLAVTKDPYGELTESYEGLTDAILKACALDAQGWTASSNTPNRYAQLKAYLAPLARSLTSRRALALIAAAIFVLAGVRIYYYDRRARDLELYQEQLMIQREQLLKESEQSRKSLQQLIDALGKTSASTPAPTSPDVSPITRLTVEYFPKDVEEGKIISDALQGFNDTLKQSPPLLTDVPSNCIFFGSKVKLEDVQQIAGRLIDKGVQIKGIFRFSNDTNKSLLVQVLSNRNIINRPPMTADEIRKASDFPKETNR